MKPWLPPVLQAVGAAAVTVGAFLLSVWLGWVIGGVLLTAFGVAAERARDRGGR